jgi:hypothetical protein
MLQIFSFLSHSDLIKIALTCKQYYRVALDETLCKYKLTLQILSFLSHSDLIKVALTCKQYYRVALDETLCKYKLTLQILSFLSHSDYSECMSDCCLMPKANEQFFSYIMARTSYIR